MRSAAKAGNRTKRHHLTMLHRKMASLAAVRLDHSIGLPLRWTPRGAAVWTPRSGGVV